MIGRRSPRTARPQEFPGHRRDRDPGPGEDRAEDRGARPSSASPWSRLRITLLDGTGAVIDLGVARPASAASPRPRAAHDGAAMPVLGLVDLALGTSPVGTSHQGGNPWKTVIIIVVVLAVHRRASSPSRTGPAGAGAESRRHRADQLRTKADAQAGAVDVAQRGPRRRRGACRGGPRRGRAGRAAGASRRSAGCRSRRPARRTRCGPPTRWTPTSTTASDGYRPGAAGSGSRSLRSMSQVPAATRTLRVLRFLAGQPDPCRWTGSCARASCRGARRTTC